MGISKIGMVRQSHIFYDDAMRKSVSDVHSQSHFQENEFVDEVFSLVSMASNIGLSNEFLLKLL